MWFKNLNSGSAKRLLAGSLFSGMGNRLLVASVICIVLLVLAGLNRGFDISDEGLYVLLADPRQANVAGIFNYDLFFKLIYLLFGYEFTLVDLRLIRLISYLFGAWALMGFWKNISGEEKSDFRVFWIACLGIFVGYAFLPPTLSYNSLVVVLTCFWLKYLSKPALSWWSILGLGFVIALMAYVKISVLPFLMLISLLVIWVKNLDKLKLTLVLFLPLLVLECFFWLTLGENAAMRLWEGIPSNRYRPTYQFTYLIKSVLVGIFWPILLAVLFFLCGYTARFKKVTLGYFVWLLASGVGFWVAYQTHITPEWNHLVLLFSAAVIAYRMGKRELGLFELNPWMLLLFILPFALHFGSNVYWLRIGTHYWVFWILGLMLIAKSKVGSFALPLAMLSILLVFNGIWWHPFGQERPLWTEKLPLHRTAGEVIYLNAEEIVIAEKIKGLKIGEGRYEILAAYRIPGLVWLAGKNVPFSPGFWELAQIETFFKNQPQQLIYSGQEELPRKWRFHHQSDLGSFQGNRILHLWN